MRRISNAAERREAHMVDEPRLTAVVRDAIRDAAHGALGRMRRNEEGAISPWSIAPAVVAIGVMLSAAHVALQDSSIKAQIVSNVNAATAVIQTDMQKESFSGPVSAAVGNVIFATPTNSTAAVDAKSAVNKILLNGNVSFDNFAPASSFIVQTTSVSDQAEISFAALRWQSGAAGYFTNIANELIEQQKVLNEKLIAGSVWLSVAMGSTVAYAGWRVREKQKNGWHAKKKLDKAGTIATFSWYAALGAFGTVAPNALIFNTLAVNNHTVAADQSTLAAEQTLANELGSGAVAPTIWVNQITGNNTLNTVQDARALAAETVTGILTNPAGTKSELSPSATNALIRNTGIGSFLQNAEENITAGNNDENKKKTSLIIFAVAGGLVDLWVFRERGTYIASD
jgi:hypothetical protein